MLYWHQQHLLVCSLFLSFGFLCIAMHLGMPNANTETHFPYTSQINTPYESNVYSIFFDVIAAAPVLKYTIKYDHICIAHSTHTFVLRCILNKLQHLLSYVWVWVCVYNNAASASDTTFLIWSSINTMNIIIYYAVSSFDGSFFYSALKKHTQR